MIDLLNNTVKHINKPKFFFDIKSFVFFVLLALINANFIYSQSINLISPNGGEILSYGSNINIEWIGTGILNVSIEYSINGGANWKTIATNAPSSGVYLWAVPNEPTTLGLVRVKSGSTVASSTPFFFIKSPQWIVNSKVGILPIGNSITFDVMRAEFRYTQDRISYRGTLWDSLRSNNYNFDFIGHKLGGYYKFPDPENNGIPGITDFQVDYLLRSGFDLTNGIQVTPANYLSVYSPDIVLLHIGINGITLTDPDGTSPVDIENILSWIKDFNSNIWVIVALIIDKVPTIPQVTTFNNNVRNMVNTRIVSGDNILLVDMHSALTYAIDNIPPYTLGDMYDDTHPNDNGKLKMANEWFRALKLILPNPQAIAPTSFTSSPKTKAYLGLPYRYNADANGIGAPSYSLEEPVPAGMTINSKTGIIDWKPMALGIFSIGIKATNSFGFLFQNFNITVSQPPPLVNSMVSYWQFEENGSPESFEDLPGINDAIPIDASSNTTGIVGNALEFDGSNKVDVLDDSSLYFYPGEGLAIEMWVKTTRSGAPVLLGKRGGGYSHYHIGFNAENKLYFEIRDSLGSIAFINGPILNDGLWHHVAGVIDRTNNRLRIYADGVGTFISKTFHSSGFYNYDPLTIGYYKNTFFYEGLLDEVAIYNRRVLGTEIARHYISGLARKGYTDNYVLVRAKALLQGPYNSVTGIMDTAFKVNNLIPKTVHPYGSAPWNYNGLERIVSYPDSVVDWVLVELRDSTNPATVVATRAAFIKKDGSIIDILPYTILGVSDVIFPEVSSGHYYVAIKHRNHLAMMSNKTIALSKTAFLYDFTDSLSKAYTTSSSPMANLGGGKFGMWAGDINQDKQITTSDYAQWYNSAFIGDSGYKKTDLNMDSQVNISDYTMWFRNALAGGQSTVP